MAKAKARRMIPASPTNGSCELSTNIALLPCPGCGHDQGPIHPAPARRRRISQDRALLLQHSRADRVANHGVTPAYSGHVRPFPSPGAAHSIFTLGRPSEVAALTGLVSAVAGYRSRFTAHPIRAATGSRTLQAL